MWLRGHISSKSAIETLAMGMDEIFSHVSTPIELSACTVYSTYSLLVVSHYHSLFKAVMSTQAPRKGHAGQIVC